MHQNAATPNEAVPGTEILASWSYSVREWIGFLNWERRHTVRAIVVAGCLLGIASFLLVHFVLDKDLGTSLFCPGVFILLTGSLIMFGRSGGSTFNRSKNPEVLITTSGVLVNGKLTSFGAENFWLKRVEIIEKGALNMLEFGYHRPGKGRKSLTEMRVPIQRGKLREAVRVQEYFEAFLRK